MSEFSNQTILSPIDTLRFKNHLADENMRVEVYRALILSPLKFDIVYQSKHTFYAKNPIFAEWHGRLLMAFFIAPAELTNTTGGVRLAWLKEGSYSEISNDTIFGIGPDFMVPKVKHPLRFHEDPRLMPMANGSMLLTYMAMDFNARLQYLKATIVINPDTQKVEFFHSQLAGGEKNYLSFEFSHHTGMVVCGHHYYRGAKVSKIEKPSKSSTNSSNVVIVPSKLEDSLYDRKRHLRGAYSNTTSYSVSDTEEDNGNHRRNNNTHNTTNNSTHNATAATTITTQNSNDSTTTSTPATSINTTTNTTIAASSTASAAAIANSSIYYMRQLHPLHIIELLTHTDPTTGEQTFTHKDIVKNTKAVTLPFHKNYYQGGLRGSSPPVLINGVMFSFFHTKTTVPYAGIRHTYFMGAITFCPTFPFNIHSISSYPILTPGLYDGPWFNRNTDYVVYPTGVVLDDDREHMFVSVGYNDIHMMVFKFNIEDVFDSLEHVTDCQYYLDQFMLLHGYTNVFPCL